jgi:hypothetical protein
LIYYGNALSSSLNIGYRHILPILPFLSVIGGGAARWVQRQWQRLVLIGLGTWLALSSLLIHPFYLAYFNEFAGGPLNGSRYFVVSDLDWGQDLPGLRAYLAENSVTDDLYLSWFGTTPPEHYGIAYHRLPGWPPPEHPERVAFHPDYPAPGIYAISAANLVGARLPGDDPFHWFRQRPYEAHIGYSIFIYEVPRLLDVDHEPAHVALSGMALDALPAGLIETQFRTNDIRPRWFDAAMALPFVGEQGFLILGDVAVHPQLAKRFLVDRAPLAAFTSSRGQQGTLYAWSQKDLAAYVDAIQRSVMLSSTLIPTSAPERFSLPMTFGSSLSLRGYEVLVDDSVSPEYLKVLSVWRVEAPLEAAPLAMFVHGLSSQKSASLSDSELQPVGAQGFLWGQDDRLSVVAESLRPGDCFVQVHQFALPEDADLSELWLQMGVYRRDSMQRYTLNLPSLPSSADRVLLLTGFD